MSELRFFTVVETYDDDVSEASGDDDIYVKGNDDGGNEAGEGDGGNRRYLEEVNDEDDGVPVQASRVDVVVFHLVR